MRRYALLAAFILLAACGGGSSSKTEATTTTSSSSSAPATDPSSMLGNCHNVVKDKLKAPATAQFDLDKAPLIDQLSHDKGAETWGIHGTVDAQNGFGALLRSNYSCIVQKNAASDLEIGLVTVTGS